LRPGDRIRIEGSPDGQEYAPLDYIEIVNSEKRQGANQHRFRNNDSP